MSEPLDIQCLPSTRLSDGLRAELYRLCDAAYGCSTQPFFEQLGQGEHLFGWSAGVLRCHLMWITRWLQPEGFPPLRTAYIEMVATDPGSERRGYATALLNRVVPLLDDFRLAALCPATEKLYARLGWRFWEGPLAARRNGQLISTPDERVMILSLPRTPPLDFGRPLSIEWRLGEIW